MFLERCDFILCEIISRVRLSQVKVVPLFVFQRPSQSVISSCLPIARWRDRKMMTALLLVRKFMTSVKPLHTDINYTLLGIFRENFLTVQYT